MRVCHPFPVALKAETTSSESRMLTAFFGVSDIGRPRFGSTASSSAGNTSSADLKFFKSSLVSSRTSPFLSVNGDRFAMSLSLPVICLAKTDYPDTSRDRSETDYMQPFFKIPDSNKPLFWILVSVIFGINCPAPIEFIGSIEWQISLLLVFLGFSGVKFNSHGFIVYTKNMAVNQQTVVLTTGNQACLDSSR